MTLSRIWGGLALWGLIVWSSAPALADASRLVLVLAPRRDDAALIEVTARVQGELRAAGFQVVTREPPSGATPLRAVAQAGSDLSPSAVLWIVAASTHTLDRPNLEIWLSDRLLGRISMARLTSAPQHPADASSLAVQAVELLSARLSQLRAGLLSADAEPSADSPWIEQKAAPLPAPVAAPTPKAVRSPRADWFGVGVGVAVLMGSGKLPPLPLPLVSFVWSHGEPRSGDLPLAFDLRASFAGLVPAQTVRREEGSARLDQLVAELTPTLRIVPRAPVEPSFGVGLGVYSLGVSGRAAQPYETHDRRMWSPLGSLSLGLRSRPWSHLSLGVSGQLSGALSRAAVGIANHQVARPGGGMWLVRAELTVIF